MNAEAIAKLLELTRLVRTSLEAIDEVGSMIQQAQEEGRDLSDDEVTEVRERTDRAIDELQSLK